MTDTLRAQLARVNPGDTLTVELRDGVTLGPGIVKKEGGWLTLGGLTVRWGDGTPAAYVAAIIEHTPALPSETDEDVIWDGSGDTWAKVGGGKWSLYHGEGFGGAYTWAEIQQYAPFRTLADLVKEAQK